MAKGMGDNPLKVVLAWGIGIGTLAFFFLIMLILFGNLSGNVGFASGTAGYNDTQNVIGNYTTGVVNTSAQFPTIGTILGVAVLLLILVAILIWAMTKLGSLNTGTASGSFG